MNIKFAREKTENGILYCIAIRIWRIAFCFAINWLDRDAKK